MIGLGSCSEPDTERAAQTVAEQARAGLQGEAGWALAFSGGRHEPETFTAALRRALGEQVPVVGGAAVGVITHQLLSYDGFECAVALLPRSLGDARVLPPVEFGGGERAAGRELGEQLRGAAPDGGSALLFYDSIKAGPPPDLYVGSVLLDGLAEGLAGKEVNLVGAGLVGDLHLSKSFVFTGDAARKHVLQAVVLPAGLKAHTTIMHGCSPVSPFLEVTRIDGPVLYELDGRPALEVVKEQLGDIDPKSLSLTVTLGEKHGDRFAPYDESAYVNRLVMAALEDGSLRLFEADFKAGTQLQVMSRDNDVMKQSASRRAAELMTSLGGRALLAFYVDCAGRTRAFCGADEEEADYVRRAVGEATPLLGFYSGVEIAPLLGRNRPLDWTGVLTAFTARD